MINPDDIPAPTTIADPDASLFPDLVSMQAAVLAANSDETYVFSREGRFLYTNQAGANALGLTSEQIIGKNGAELGAPADLVAMFDAERDRLFTSGEAFEGKVSYPTVRGVRDFEYRWSALHDSNGAVTAALFAARDVTDRNRAEAALRESEKRYRSIVDTATEGIWIVDRDFRTTYVNARLTELLGYSVEELQGRHVLEFIFDSDRASMESRFAERKHGKSEVYDLRYRRKDGSVVWLLSSTSALMDESGKFDGAIGMFTDITQRKQQEKTRQFLTEASELLGSSLDYVQTLQKVAILAVPHIADWCSVDMLAEDGSISQLAVAHVDPAKLKWGHELRRRYPPDPNAPHGLPQVLRTGQSEIYTDITDEMLAASARDQEHHELLRQVGLNSLMIVPMTARGRILGAVTLVATDESGQRYTEQDLLLAEGLAARAALAIDNSRLYREAQAELAERRRAQGALRLSEERFRFALANSDISVYMADRDLRYTWAYSGRTSSELTHLYGKTDEELLEAGDAAKLTQIKLRVMHSGVEERHVVRATFHGAEPGFYETLFAPLRDPAGNIIGVTGTVHDITARQKVEDALAHHQMEVEALNVRLQRSMRETHHRVKNNLQVIAALVNMQQMQYEEMMPTSELKRLTHHVRALASIHDLLTRQAQDDAEVSDISVQEMMEQLMPTVQGIVEGRDITFDVQALRLPVRYSTPIAVLVNELVSNALKHGSGAIHVCLSVDGDMVVLEVLDEGAGFAADFDPLRAAHTGLDLIASLSEIDLRGGVRYENRPTGGGRVVVEFPHPSAAGAS